MISDDTGIQFTHNHLQDRELIMRMLKHEDKLFFSHGQEMYRNELYDPSYSLTPQLAMQRLTLQQFGFDTSDDSLAIYRQIVQQYWKSANEYDAEVLDCVVYLRENKLLRYKSPQVVIGDIAKDVPLLNLNGSATTLAEQWGPCTGYNHVMICAFSGS
jgi:hypothetical protein